MARTYDDDYPELDPIFDSVEGEAFDSMTPEEMADAWEEIDMQANEPSDDGQWDDYYADIDDAPW